MRPCTEGAQRIDLVTTNSLVIERPAGANGDCKGSSSAEERTVMITWEFADDESERLESESCILAEAVHTRSEREDEGLQWRALSVVVTASREVLRELAGATVAARRASERPRVWRCR